MHDLTCEHCKSFLHKYQSREYYYFCENSIHNTDDDIELNMYAHLINVIITIILIRNDKNMSIKVFKNYRLKHAIEIDFFNVFHIQNFDVENVKYLIIKKSKFIHRVV